MIINHERESRTYPCTEITWGDEIQISFYPTDPTIVWHYWSLGISSDIDDMYEDIAPSALVMGY